MRQYYREFELVDQSILISHEYDTINLSVNEKMIVNIENVNYILDCNSNLLSLTRFRQSEITYHDDDDYMSFRINEILVRKVKRKSNLFVLELADAERIMSTREKSAYLKSLFKIRQL